MSLQAPQAELLGTMLAALIYARRKLIVSTVATSMILTMQGSIAGNTPSGSLVFFKVHNARISNSIYAAVTLKGVSAHIKQQRTLSRVAVILVESAPTPRLVLCNNCEDWVIKQVIKASLVSKLRVGPPPSW
ncbi:hypothetical protein CVT25_014481 [Psilocybe cyanescens]|uniref:Uncharacterized protein n=1 Tax=Psilocybe cyanescens TaxID=93625 RepID=A0A409XRA3_PSICY|nr:hypothetical protein CVT25_014481 [Psilocybe cyanescens]